MLRHDCPVQRPARGDGIEIDRTILHAADPGGDIRRVRVHVGKDLVLQIADVDVASFEAVLCRLQIGALVERVANGGIGVDHLLLKRRRIGRLERGRPEVRRRRIQDERAEVVLGPLDRRFGEDHPLVVARDLRLRLDDVDGRERADLDPLPVVGERLLGEPQRFLLRLQIVDGVGQVPVRVLHVAVRLHDHGIELDVGQIPQLLARHDLLPDQVDREVAQQRLRELQVQARGELGAEVAGNVVRREPCAAPVCGVGRAPGEVLLQPDVGGETSVVDAGGGTGELVVGRPALRLARKPGVEHGRPERPGLRDADILNLRINPLNLNPEVLFQPELHRVVNRETAEGFGRRRRLLRGRLGRRLDNAFKLQLSALAENGR